MSVLVIEIISLTTSLSSIQLANPFILASGVMDEDAGSMKRILDNGAGAVVTKSIGLQPRTGHPNPTFVELDHGLLNAMGLPNPGIKAFCTELEDIKSEQAIIIGSIFGSNEQEFISLACQMQDHGASAVELNLSCPHAKGYGLELGQDPEEIKIITQEVKQHVTIPVFVKLSPNVNDICILAKAAESAGADGIVAINTVKAMKIDIETKTPILSNKIGGYSGEAIKPIGVRNVYDLYSTIAIPLIGVGGISSGKDAIEYFMAGASAVQIGSAIYTEGITIFSKLAKEVTSWMHEHDYTDISELIGVSHS